MELTLVGIDPLPREKMDPLDQLSYSRTSTYIQCGEKYRLTYGHGFKDATWYASLAGSAIHEVTEMMDKAAFRGFDFYPRTIRQATELFYPVFIRNLRQAQSDELTIKASGRKLKESSLAGGPNKKDREWWEYYGPHFTLAWAKYRLENPDIVTLAMPDGTPGIEVHFDLPVSYMGEQAQLRGSIDRVLLHPKHGLTVVDLKTGAVPASNLQLATYNLALSEMYGLSGDTGMYWFPYPEDKKNPVEGTAGHEGRPVELNLWNRERVASMYVQARRGIEGKVFLPNVSSNCRGCGVAQYCWAIAGSKAQSTPIVSEYGERESNEV